MTTLFAFLGTNDYVPVHYELDGRKTDLPEAFTQAAIFQLLPEPPSRVVLAITVQAGRGELAGRDAGDANLDRLLCRFAELGVPRERIETIDIPDGGSEDELWQIFQMLGAIGAGEVIFDCTHGFRALPIVATLALPFHGALRGFTIARVLYGAFEVLGTPRAVRAQIENGLSKTAPVFDLTAMLDIPVWHQAIAEFRNHGRARGLEDRLRGPTRELGRQLGKANPRDLSQLPGRLANLSDKLAVTKVDDVGDLALALERTLDDAAHQIALHPLARRLRPFETIVTSLHDLILPLVPRADDGAGDLSLRIARWYIEREQYASAYTTLRETVTDAVVRVAQLHGVASVATELGGVHKDYLPESSRYRMTVDGWFFRIVDGKDPADPVNPTELAQVRLLLGERSSLLEAARSIQGLIERRNRLNHAFKGESGHAKVERNRETGRLWLHEEALADLEVVRHFLSACDEAGAPVDQARPPTRGAA